MAPLESLVAMPLKTQLKEQLLRLVPKQYIQRSAHCAFALSTGRAGTTTLTQLLRLSPKLHAFHERPPKLLRETLAAFYDVQDRRDFYGQVFEAAHMVAICHAHLTGRTYFDASNRLTFLAPAISASFAMSKFVHIYRHPGDVVRSGMRRGWYVHHPWDPHRISPAKGDAAFAKWAKWTPFQKVCWYWSTINAFALDFADSVGPDRLLSVRFEDLMDADSGEYERLFRFLDVDPPSRLKVQEVLGLAHNKQSSGSFPRYPDWPDSDKEALIGIAGNVMRRLNYDFDACASANSIKH